MANNCNTSWCDDALKSDFGIDCPQLFVPGVERIGYIWNVEDVDKSVLIPTAANCNIFDQIKMLPGKKAYKFRLPANNPFNGTAVNLNAGDNFNTFTNTLAMWFPANDPDFIRDIINPMSNGRFGACIENKAKAMEAKQAGFSAFQLMGIYQGLKASALDHDKYSTDYNGGWYAEFTETNVPSGGTFLYNTSYAATKALLEGLLTPADDGKGD